MSSYQQIPASQNPYPSLPYTQSFPDEPETESSQLVAPLHNHPQHYYPPHHVSGYGQQPVPYGAVQGSNQHPQFMAIPVDPERMGLGMKISDIEKRLDNGWYFVYKIYLYINIVVSVISILQLSVCLLVLPILEEDFKGAPAFFFTGILLFLGGLYGWVLHYSLIFKNAMSDKNLEGARRGMKLMIGNSVCSFVITIVLIGAAEFVKRGLPRDLQKESWVPYYVQAFVYLYALPTVLKLWGAKKVINLLAERETFVHELNTRYGTNLA